MEPSADDEGTDHSHANLKPSKPDPYQFYVFLAHLVFAVAISILSLSGGLYSWFIGTGVLTPVLLAATAFLYANIAGMNWYRNELLPYMRRKLMVHEFEIERFLKYKRNRRFSALLAGYIATVVCQLVWFPIAEIVVIFMEHVSGPSDVLYVAFFCIIILYLLIMLLIGSIFYYLIDLAFSDIKQLIEFDEDVQDFLKAKAKEEKEKNEEEDEVDT